MIQGSCVRRKTCRLCNGDDVNLVISLTPTPPANSFVSKKLLGVNQEVFPLDVFFCAGCGHVQLLDIINPKVLFEDYVYVSGTSRVFINHFETYAKKISNNYISKLINPLVVELGSNDGTLLKAFRKLGYRVLGIDPAIEIARQASKKGIETISQFFTSKLAMQIKNTHGRANIICANNVFAHADDLIDITKGIRSLLTPDGVFVFEVSYLLDVFDKGLYDTIYHEHLAYHSVAPLKKFFCSQKMHLISVERINTHGGSIRGVVQLEGGAKISDGSVEELIILENRAGLNKLESLKTFSKKIDNCKQKLVKCLQDFKANGKSIAAFGAPAKATTLMYHFQISADVIDFIVDDNPMKQGLYTPGMHIPVYSTKYLYELDPDVVVILAWNFADSIIKKHVRYLDRGGQFLIPLPDLRIVCEYRQ